MILPSNYVNFTSIKGIPLSTINPGSQEIALPRDATIEALRMLKDSPIAVIGGDVLKLSGGLLTYTYENWFCNKKEGELASQYACRCLQYSMEYVMNFDSKGAFDPLFVFVLTDIS